LKNDQNISTFQIVGMDQMEQWSVVLFLRLNGLSKKAICHELVALLQEHSISYPSVIIFYSAGRLFWAGIRKRPHQPLSPKDGGLGEVNELNEEIVPRIRSCFTAQPAK
jgi:hypothetical protein